MAIGYDEEIHDTKWNRLARRINSTPPLDGSRIVYVSVDCQGCEYPKYYTRIDEGLPGNTDLEGLIGTLESGEEAEIAWHGNVTGVVQLVDEGWSGGRPLEFASSHIPAVLECVPEDVLRGSGYDPDEMRIWYGHDKDDERMAGVGFDISHWDVGATPRSIHPRLAAMGVPVAEWWNPVPGPCPDICEMPGALGFLEDSDCASIRLVCDGRTAVWFPNTAAGRWRLARGMVRVRVDEIRLSGEDALLFADLRSEEELFRHVYGEPPETA